MEIYAIPFDDKFIVYLPLRRLAFVCNTATVRYIQDVMSDNRSQRVEDVDGFLDSIGFWKPDPEPPKPWVPSEEHRPTMAALLMTTACNLRCTYCYARGGEGSVLQLDFSTGRIVIDAAYENALSKGQKFFSLTFHGGGEPTMNWDVMVAAVEHARSKELRCDISMSSNGVWTHRQQEFILGNFDGLSLSFDGIREVQDVQRPMANGRGSFDRVMDNIRAMDECSFRYGVRMTVTVESCPRLAESVAFLCEETGCTGMQVEPCYTTGRGGYSDPTPEQSEIFIRSFMEAFEVASKAGRHFSYSGARPWLVTGAFCRAPEDALVVTPEGDLMACFETYSRRHPLNAQLNIGSVSDNGVEVDIDALRNFAAQHDERRGECEGCFCYWHCGGDCVTRCMLSSGESRERCNVNREITKQMLVWYIADGNGVWHGSNMRQIKQGGMRVYENPKERQATGRGGKHFRRGRA